MVKRFSHDHPLYKSDNASVYSMLEEATRGTQYASTIKAHSRTKNGRSAWLAMISSHAGTDKWEKLQKDKLNFMSQTKWNGKVYSLDKFCSLHRNAYVALEEAAIHVNFQLPTDHTRVGYLIDNITNQDADLRAAIGSIRLNQDNMRDDFEAAVTALLPVCPYSKSRSGRGDGRGAEVSDVTLKGASESKTGVDLRWHTVKEYKALSKAQRRELYQWQQTKNGKAAIEKQKAEADEGSSKKRKLTSQVSSLEKKLKTLQGRLDANKNDSEEVASIAAAIAANAPQSSPNSRSSNNQSTTTNQVKFAEPYTAAAVAVQKILKRKKEE